MGKVFSKSKLLLIISGALFAFAAILLSIFGNPANMAFCIACFIRDIAGSLKMHSAAPVQYFRPEIVGILLGSLVASLVSKEYKSTAGSSPMIRFFLGFSMMIGALCFLGCPLRMVIRMAAGDLNAYVALIGFIGGVVTGSFALKKDFSLGRAYPTQNANGIVLTAAFSVLFILTLLFGNMFASSTAGPGSKHAAIALSLVVGICIGAVAQKSRVCFAGGIRDAVLIKNYDLLMIIGTLFVVLLGFNLITGKAHFSFSGQPIAHSKHLWSILGMYAVGLCAVLAGGCPLRQLILAGQGSGDSAMTALGMLIAAGFAHQFNLASAASSPTSAGGPSISGKVVLVACIIISLAIAFTQKRKEQK